MWLKRGKKKRKPNLPTNCELCAWTVVQTMRVRERERGTNNKVNMFQYSKQISTYQKKKKKKTQNKINSFYSFKYIEHKYK